MTTTQPLLSTPAYFARYVEILDETFGKDETIGEAFARCRAEYDFTLSTDGYFECDFSARRKLDPYGYVSGDPTESLTIGELYAAYVDAALYEADEDYSAALSALLARNESGDLPSGPAFAAEARKLDSKVARRRTAITQAAYGVSYSAFVKALYR